MADNLQNTSKIDTNVISKSALVTDLNASYINTEQYNYARNATRNSSDGDIGSIEMSQVMNFVSLHLIR